MVLIIIRTLLIFITLMIVMRLSGKRQIGEMQPFELVITLIIADLACIPMADTSIPLLYGVVAIVTIFCLHQIITLVDLKSNPLKTVVSGEASLVINQDGIDVYHLRQNNLDASDLLESLRSVGYFSPEAVLYGIYESTGNFSALKRDGYQDTSLPVLFINDGTWEEEAFLRTHIPKELLQTFLSERKLKLKTVYLLTMDGNGHIYYQREGGRYQTADLTLPKELTW